MKTITFTGGLGAQILSAAAYFYLEKIGTPVRASLDYFNLKHHVATPGNKGEISVWKWELHMMSINPDRFVQTLAAENEYVFDGEEKLQLGLLGLADYEIRSKFNIVNQANEVRKFIFGNDKYICVHVRRGDYTNVASFLVSDESFVDAIKPLTGLVSRLLLVTDTEPDSNFKDDLKSLKINTQILVGGDVAVVHGLMRLSDILICSNSQFSYTAAALRPINYLTFLPTQHDNEPNSPTNRFLRRAGKFQIATEIHRQHNNIKEISSF